MFSFLTQLFIGTLISACTTSCANDAQFWPSAKQHDRFTLRHIEGGGIGYNKGYTTIEGFFAPHPEKLTLMPFADLRAHVFNNGKFAANAGVGFRKSVGSRVWGLNSYFDYRNIKKSYSQIGVGFENLGRRCDFRVNGYLPLQTNSIPTCNHALFAGFSGNTMLVQQNYQFAMRGANAELGVHFCNSKNFEFYAAAGAYYFNGKIGPQIWGGKARLLGRFKDYATLELSNSYDRMFRNRFQCQLSFTLPFGNSHASDECDYQLSNMLASRMVQPVERQEIIVLGNAKKCSPAIDPTTGRPFNFVFVDNTSHSLGTYQSPYPTLAQAQENSRSGDIIYVFPGDGTTNGMDQGIVLQENQRFWGSGINHTLPTAQGILTVPAQSPTAPQMTNRAGDGITVANINEVSGFTITDVLNNGIFGANAQNIDILQCAIDGSQFGDNIHLEYPGTSGQAVFDSLTVTNGDINGIFIDSSASTVCSVNNCTIQNNGVSGINATTAGQATMNISNNIIEQNIAGGALLTFNGPATLAVSNNNFNSNRSINLAPIIVVAAADPIDATISNNNITNNTCSAIHAVLNNTDSAQLNIQNNTITNNTSGSIGSSFGSAIFIDPNSTLSGNCLLNITNNTFTGNQASALNCSNGSFNDFQVTAVGNTIANNGGSGFVFANASNSFTLNSTDNIIINGGNHGITTSGGITLATANMTIANNQITGNTNYANAIALSHEGTSLNLIVTENNLSDNDTSGIIMYSSNTIENVTATIENNIVKNNQNLGSNFVGGVDLEQYTNLLGTFANNILTNNAGGGLYVSTTLGSPSVCWQMSGNQSDNGYILSNNAGTFNLAPCDVNTVNSGTISTSGTITNVQSCPDGIPCS